MNQQNDSNLNALIEKYNEMKSEINRLKDEHRIVDERLKSKFVVKERGDFASDLEYEKFRNNQNKLFDDYHQSKAKLNESEAKMNEFNNSIFGVERNDKPAKKAEQTIQSQDEEKLDLDIKLDPSKSSSGQDNIDATANRIVENSASIKVEASVSDYAKNSENVNSYDQILFNIPDYKLGVYY